MKKRTRIVLIACAAVICMTALLYLTGIIGWKTLYLPEKVEVFSVNIESGKSTLIDSVEYTYDENNHLAQLILHDHPHGTLNVTNNKNGNVTALEGTLRVSDDALLEVNYTYTYSPAGKLLFCSNGAGTQSKTYNARGQLTAKEFRSKIDIESTQYTYDLLGQLRTSTFRKERNGEEIISTHATYEYNSKGQLILETLYDTGNTVLCEVAYRYENGSTVAERTDHFDSGSQTGIYTFDSAGNPTSVAYSGDSTMRKYIFSYKEIRVPGYSLRNSFSHLEKLPETGIVFWQYRNLVPNFSTSH